MVAPFIKTLFKRRGAQYHSAAVAAVSISALARVSLASLDSSPELFSANKELLSIALGVEFRLRIVDHAI